MNTRERDQSYRVAGHPYLSRFSPLETTSSRLQTAAAVFVGAVVLIGGIKLVTHSPDMNAEATLVQPKAVCKGVKISADGTPLTITLHDQDTMLTLIEATGIPMRDIGESASLDMLDTPVVDEIKAAYVDANPALEEAAVHGDKYLNVALMRTGKPLVVPDCSTGN